jgi:hypothetical protein
MRLTHVQWRPTGQRCQRQRPILIAFSEPPGIQIVVNTWPSRQRTGRSKRLKQYSHARRLTVCLKARITRSLLQSHAVDRAVRQAPPRQTGAPVCAWAHLWA